VAHRSLQELYSMYTAGSTSCAKRGEARGNECELCSVCGPMCDGWMTWGWKIRVGWLSRICMYFATCRKMLWWRAHCAQCLWTRDMAINSKAKSNHHPSASDQSENDSFSLDSKKPQTLPGTAYLFQARVRVNFNSSEPFSRHPCCRSFDALFNLWANCLT